MKKIAGLLAAAAAAGFVVVAGENGGALRGFRPSRTAWERAFEERLARLPSAPECGEFLRTLTREPHVAGTAAGFGVNADGSTYRGSYASVDLDSLKIGPGTAPRALLYALKVFGCKGITACSTARWDGV